MTRAIGVLLLGFLAVVVQGALAAVVSPPWCPDLALLVVLAIGLRWEGLASGLFLAFALGYAADVVSGGLRGGHALLRMFVFIGARLAARQLNLAGALPLAASTAGLSIAYGVAVVLMTGFFSAATLPAWGWFDLLPHAIVNGLAAPLVSAVVGRLLAWLGDDADPRRLLSLGSSRGAS